MALRPTWQGHLKLSLVTCPVALYTATSSGGDVHFNLINPDTGNRIKMITTDPDTGPVERSSLVKGYEVEKGEYILLTDDEIKAVKLESTRTIDIERFVPAADIDRLYWDNPYYLAPNGKLAEEAFGVIREAMRAEGQIALARVVLSTRERLLALEARDNSILAYSLRTRDEVRDAGQIFDAIKDATPDPAMIDIARRIIEQKAGPFDPSQFTDRYEEALKALIASKQRGVKPSRSNEPSDTDVGDLMSALRASLQGSSPRKARPRPASRRRRLPRLNGPAPGRLVLLKSYPSTPDGRYFVVRGRLWRSSNSALSEAERQSLVNDLMDSRRSVRDALRAADPELLRQARAGVQKAKMALGERGPVWWTDAARLQRRMAVNTPYADWYRGLSA